MKLRKLLVLVGIVLMTTNLLVACVDKKAKPRKEIRMTQEEKKNLKKEQDKIALYIVNHYEDVKKIEFYDYTKGGFAQSDEIFARFNDESIFMHIELEEKNYGNFVRRPKQFHLKKKETITNIRDLSQVEIKYYEESANE